MKKKRRLSFERLSDRLCLTAQLATVEYIPTNGLSRWYMDDVQDPLRLGELDIDYGFENDTPLAGRWVSGQGSKAAVVRQEGNRLHWYFDTDGEPFPEFDRLFGNAGDIPLIGDFDQNGTDDTAVVRAGGAGNQFQWILDWTGDGVQDTSFLFGGDNGVPVLGHWLTLPANVPTTQFQAGVATPGANSWVWNLQFTPTTALSFGNLNATPVAADINGDGNTDIGTVLDPGGDGILVWEFDTNLDGIVDVIREYGRSPHKPVIAPSDWDYAEVKATHNGIEVFDDFSGSDIDLGVVPIGDNRATSIVVTNTGSRALQLGPVNVPSGFQLTDALKGTLAPNASDTFVVRFVGTGYKTGDISFTTNDGNEQVFNFGVKAEREIQVPPAQLGAVEFKSPPGLLRWYMDDVQDPLRLPEMDIDYGFENDLLVAGRWVAGQGSKAAIVRQEGVNLNWYFDTDGEPFAEFNRVFGRTGDIPLVGDFDQNGVDDTAVVRAGGAGNQFTWFLDWTGEGGTDQSFLFGNDSGVPVIGHWQTLPPEVPYTQVQAGVATRGANSWLWNLQFTDTTGLSFGDLNATPIAADINGDGNTDIGTVFNPGGDGLLTWNFDTNLDGVADVTRQYGRSNHRPVIAPGNWDYAEIRAFRKLAFGNDIEVFDDYSVIDLGIVNPGVQESITIEVSNTGRRTLGIGEISVPSGFTVTDGLSSTIAPGQSDNLVLNYTGTEDVSGVVQFATTDGNESVFGFTLLASRGQPRVVPIVQSRDGAPQSIYLDFDGDFQPTWGDVSQITTPQFNRPNDGLPPCIAVERLCGELPSVLDSKEVNEINEIFHRVAEHFRPFDINVTTSRPAASFENRVALHVVVGGDGSWFGTDIAGAAELGSFSNDKPNVVFAFVDGFSAQAVATSISQQVGHAFGLLPQGDPVDFAPRIEGTFWSGPIMGDSYDSNVTRWANGPVTDGERIIYDQQDDIALLMSDWNGLRLRPDDHGDDLNTATIVQVSAATEQNEIRRLAKLVAKGVIEETEDVDVFRFEWQSGGFRLDLENTTVLSPKFELLSETGQIRQSGSNLFFNDLAAGTYYLRVSSNGAYGSVGSYAIIDPDSSDPIYTIGSSAVRPIPKEDLPGSFVTTVRPRGDDIDQLYEEIRDETPNISLDIDRNSQVDQSDVDFYVRNIAETQYGDTDLDLCIDFSDFLRLSDNFGKPGGWNDGDFDGDGFVLFPDFLLLLGYMNSPQPGC